MIVVGLARRVERVEQLKSSLPVDLQKNLYAKKCDVSVEQEIVDTFRWIEKEFNEVHVFVNNAGIARRIDLTAADNSTGSVARRTFYIIRKKKKNESELF